MWWVLLSWIIEIFLENCIIICGSGWNMSDHTYCSPFPPLTVKWSQQGYYECSKVKHSLQFCSVQHTSIVFPALNLSDRRSRSQSLLETSIDAIKELIFVDLKELLLHIYKVNTDIQSHPLTFYLQMANPLSSCVQEEVALRATWGNVSARPRLF